MLTAGIHTRGRIDYADGGAFTKSRQIVCISWRISQLTCSMGGAPAATLCRNNVQATTFLGPSTTPKGLSGSGLHTPAGALFAGRPHKIYRQYTLCKSKPGDLQQTQALPFMLDLTLALATDMQPPSIVQSSLDEMVFQATLQVPAHHALSCKLQAYGTPFAAPDLQATAEQLSDTDLEFAACLASPPDLDERMSFNLGRVMSMLEQNRAQAAGAVGRVAPAHTAAGGVQQASAGASTAQQLRGGVQQTAQQTAQQSAPKVLVSIDEAEAGAHQLHRSNSTRRQTPGLPRLARRAMQTLLGFGYLLTVLHEKHIGGQMQFSAAALTAAGSGTPVGGMIDSHRRTLKHQSSSGGVLAELKGMIRECPSLTPIGSGQQQYQQHQAAVTAADDSSSSDPAASAAATGDHYHSAPDLDRSWERISSVGFSSGRQLVRGLSIQLSLSAPINRLQSSNLRASLDEQQPGRSQVERIDTSDEAVWAAERPTPAAAAAAGAAATAAEGLRKEPCHGRSGKLDLLFDEALAQLQDISPTPPAAPAVESAAADAVTGSPVSVRPLPVADTATTQAAAAAAAYGSANGTSADAIMSHVLLDQGVLTSPLPLPAVHARAPWLPSVPGHQNSCYSNDRPGASSVAEGTPIPEHPAAADGGAVSPDASPCSPASTAPGSPLAATPRFLKPMLSMRLFSVVSPKWQYTQELKDLSTAAAAGDHHHHHHQQQQQQSGEEAASSPGGICGVRYAGLWPTMSFRLSPVRLQPPQQQQQQMLAAAAVSR